MKRLARRDVSRVPELVAAGQITAKQACEGKSAYFSRNLARLGAKHIANKTGRKATTYRCPFCNYFHISKFKFGEEEA